MAQLIHITENAVRAVFKITDDGRVRLLNMAHAAADRAEAEAFPDVPAIREATCIYPAALDTACTFEGSRLRVTLQGRTARLFRVDG